MAKYGCVELVELSADVGSRLVTMDTLLVAFGWDWKFSSRILVGVPIILVELVVSLVAEFVVVTEVELCSTSHPWRTYPWGSTR